MLLSIFLFAIAIANLCLSVYAYEKSVKKYYWHTSKDRSFKTFRERREVLDSGEWLDALDFVWSGAVILGLACFVFCHYAFESFVVESAKFWTCIVFEAVAVLTYFLVARRKILLWEKWTLTVKVILCMLIPIITGICIH